MSLFAPANGFLVLAAAYGRLRTETISSAAQCRAPLIFTKFSFWGNRRSLNRISRTLRFGLSKTKFNLIRRPNNHTDFLQVLKFRWCRRSSLFLCGGGIRMPVITARRGDHGRGFEVSKEVALFHPDYWPAAGTRSRQVL